jgi:hypothetical protein
MMSAQVGHDALGDRAVPRGRVLGDGRQKRCVWAPGDGWIKAFCADSGSHTHTISPDDPRRLAARALPDDGLPRFPERLGTTDPL